jgi:hypothetical protein
MILKRPCFGDPRRRNAAFTDEVTMGHRGSETNQAAHDVPNKVVG